jgi:predicted RNase H-like HicB family nuclease
MASFLVVIEKGQHSYGAYSPDLPGCVAVGDTVEEVEQRMREALLLHLEGLREDHLPLPQPTSRAEYIDVSIPA